MRKRRNLLQNLGCMMLAAVVWAAAPGTAQAAAQQNAALQQDEILPAGQNQEVQQAGYVSAFAARMPAQYQPTAANLLYCVDNFDAAKAQCDAVAVSSLNYWKAANGLAYGGGTTPVENRFCLYDQTYSTVPEEQLLYQIEARKSLKGTLPRNLRYTEQYAPLLEPISPDGYTYHGSVIRSWVHGSAATFKDYIPAPGDGRELSRMEISYYARERDEFNAASKEKGAAYMERLFREINWTNIENISVSHRSIPQSDGTEEILTDVDVRGWASPEYPLIHVHIRWQVESGSITVNISEENW